MNSDVNDFESLHEENSDALDLNADQDFPTQNAVHSNGNVSSFCGGDPMLQIGTEFETDEHAYTFYSRYAKLVGFSVRKDWVNRSKVHGQVVSRKFTCSREGYRRRDKRDISVKKRRKETRTGCLAHMIITRQPDGRYRVSHFEERHNHDNVNPENALASITRDSSLSLDQSPEEDEEEGGGGGGGYSSPANRSRQCDEFPMELDYHLKTERAGGTGEGEAGRLLQCFQRKRFENPSFFYLLQLDVDDRVSNIFWADDGMVSDYGHFGDVVCLDTIFRTKKDCRFPLVQFVGLNNHRRVVIFASALLYDDTVESFRWLFRTFLEAMSGIKPKAIHSDQDAAIVEAIELVFPETERSICVWQMFENSVKHLSDAVLDAQSFARDFKGCVYSTGDEEDFSRSWDELLQKYSLQQNEWLKWMFREKEKWALVYEKNTFFVDSNGSHLGETLHCDLRSHSSSGLDVLQFFKHFESILEQIRYKEAETITPRLMADVVMLRHASGVYTPRAFEAFQSGYEKSLNVVVNEQCENGSLSFDYKAKKFGQPREYDLTFDSSNDSVFCTCKKFESVGFLCSHALKVLDHGNIKVVPPKYISKRWTREARLGSMMERRETTMASRYKDLNRRILTLSSRACESDETFLFASRKLDEALEGVEKILGSKHEEAQAIEASNTSSSPQSERPEIFLDGNGVEEQAENGKGSSGVSSSLPVFVSPQATTENPIMQGLYSFEVNQAVKCIYQQPSLVIDPNTIPNMYQHSNFFTDQQDSTSQSQLLPDPLIHCSYPESITNTTQEMDLDIQHPHTASFLLFDQRYRTPDTPYIGHK